MATMAASQSVAGTGLVCPQTARVGLGTSSSSPALLAFGSSRFTGGKLAAKGASNGSRVTCGAATLAIPKAREALLVSRLKLPFSLELPFHSRQ